MMQVRSAMRPLSFGSGARAPLERSATTAWAGLPFEVHTLGAMDDVGHSGPRPGEHGMMVVTRGSYQSVLRGAHGDLRTRSGRGSMLLLSGDERADVLRITGNAELIALDLPDEWLRHASTEPATLGRRGPLPGGTTASALVAAMRQEVARGCSAGRLYAESLSLSLLSYALGLVPSHARAAGARAADARAADARAGLSASERARLTSYVHAHLDRNLSLIDLAALLGMTPRRFSARFANAFGTTPHRYLVQQRLLQGARLLESTRRDIAEIALGVGFSSQSHFTLAFRRAFGQTPRRYAQLRRATVVMA